MTNSQETQIALLIQVTGEIGKDITDIKSDIKDIKRESENKYVIKVEQELINKLANDRIKRLETAAGLIGTTIILAVLGAVLRLVIIGAK